MLEPLEPFNELERLRALYRSMILDTPSEERFDRFTRLAEILFKVPIALISFVDKDRQWFKSSRGLSVAEMPRSVSFCGHTILDDDPLVVRDAYRDPRFADNPLVTGEPYIRFYAGHAIKDSDGYKLGTFCIIDRKPRTLNVAALQALRDIVALVEQEISLTGVSDKLNSITAETLRLYGVFNQAFECMAEGFMLVDAHENILCVNQAFTQITGYTQEEVIGQPPAFYLPGHRSRGLHGLLRQSLADTGHWQGEIWTRRKDGESYPIWLSVSAILDDRGRRTHIAAVFNDLSKNKQQEERLRFLAAHDALTELPNRTSFLAQLDSALEPSQHTKRGQISVLSIGIDRFTDINDSLGYIAGDQVLREAAQRLVECVGSNGVVSRASGYVFNVLLTRLNHPTAETLQMADKILAMFAEPVMLDSHQLFLAVSIGVGLYPAEGCSAEILLRDAGVAMRKAKEEGGNNYRVYSIEMNPNAFNKLVASNNLRQGLARNEFHVHYQPRVEIASGRIVGMEALLRWRLSVGEWIPPVQFIPLAEESGVIIPLGQWVIEQACEQIKAWQTRGFRPLRVAINLSTLQFQQPDLAQRIATILRNTGVDPACLEVEITEGMAMANPAVTEKILHELKAMGLAVALDDFGTGYSSLSYLKRFPIDYLKIDRSFVNGVPHDTSDTAITRTIIAMAKNLGLKVIAEGVETKEQLQFLATEDCDEYQGFLFSKPQAARQISRLLKSTTKHESASSDGHQRLTGRLPARRQQRE